TLVVFYDQYGVHSPLFAFAAKVMKNRRTIAGDSQNAQLFPQFFPIGPLRAVRISNSPKLRNIESVSVLLFECVNSGLSSLLAVYFMNRQMVYAL
ncbi:MAG: hypothetical protein K2I59_03725, partial [Alistipes sp.]|nr:hypothetical protein [Alistipes sp.]